MLDFPRWKGDLAGKVFDKDVVQHKELLHVLFNLGAVLRLFHTGSLLVVLVRRQRLAGIWQLKFTDLVRMCFYEYVLVLCEKTVLCDFSVGLFQSPYHTVPNIYFK